MAGYGSRRDAVELALVAACPDFGAQQAQRGGHQSMVEVRQHDIITPPRQVVVKHDGPLSPGMRMLQAVGTSCPTPAQLWYVKDLDGWIVTIWIVQDALL